MTEISDVTETIHNERYHKIFLISLYITFLLA